MLPFYVSMRYDTASPLGRGGMGEVFEAWDPVLERPVALKVLTQVAPGRRQRLLQEAKLQALIDHPNVCRVYEAGETEAGDPFIAMQLIDGVPLDQAAEELGIEETAALLRTIAEAVQAAHAKGLVHRDLKPSNLLVERNADGSLTPFVLDFGIAREVEAEGLTRTGEILGTPGYMSPEQAAGGRVDRRTDVFSLGVVLYELLAGELPFRGSSQLEVVASVLRDEPVPLREVAPRVPSDLAAIVMACLEREPERRYPSARALAEDLARFLDGEPIAARRTSIADRARRAVRRHPVVAAASAVTLGAALVLAGYAAYARHQAQQQAVAAQQFGERLQRIESMLRLAYLAPPHDVRGERAEVHREIASLQAAVNRESGATRRAALLVLGRAQLALGQYGEARAALERARSGDSDPPERRLALARALGGLYEEAVHRAERLSDPELRAAETARARAELGEPARRYLASLDLDALALPAHELSWLDGLLALVEGDLEAAHEHGVKAAELRSWFYEGRLLAGRAALLEAGEHMEAGRSHQADTALARALSAYERAARIGESDPAPALGAARARVAGLRHAWDENRPLDDRLENARRWCARTLEIDPESAEALALRSEAAWTAARMVARAGGDPEPIIGAAIADGERAVELAPKLAAAWAQLGNARWVSARWIRDQGKAPWDLYRGAVAALERGLELAPNDAFLQLSLAHVLNNWGTTADRRGQDPIALWDRARAAYSAALAVPGRSSSRLYNGLCGLESDVGYKQFVLGNDPSRALARAASACQAALEINPRYLAALNNLGLVRSTEADFLGNSGRDPGPALADAVARFEAVLEIAPGRPTTSVNLANLLATLGRWRLERGEDPAAVIERATAVIEGARSRFPSDYHYVRSRLALIEAELAAGAGGSPTAAFERALTEGDEAVRLGVGPDNLMLVVSARARRAAWRLGLAAPDRDGAGRDVARGLEAVDRVLATEPERPDALAERARLAQLRAQLTTDPDARKTWLALARDSAAAAVRRRPSLRDGLADIAGP